MDPYLKYQPAYRILVCRQCSVGVWPNAVTAHFRSEAHEFTLPQIRRLAEDLKDHRLDLCRPGELQIPDSPVVSLSDLPVSLDGQRCILDPAKCAYVCRNEKVLRKHWKDEHGFSLCEVLGGSGAAKKEMIAERLQLSVRRPVPCQRLFASRHGSQYFEVYVDTARPIVDTTRRGPAKDAILSELASLEKTQQLTGRTFVATSSSKEISPWLQLTRWLGYLDGCTLCDTARLAWSPSAGTEGDLVEVCASLDRILDQALAAIQEDRVNPFDQMRINSFLQRPRASDKPLAFRLQKSTYRVYRDVWKRLLCFAHRTLKHDQLPRLRHRLTNGQIVEHTELFRMVEYLRCLKASGDDTEEMLRAARADVDQSCLRFCMSLLDHTLNGDIYESVIVGFFAVAAIDVTKNILREAHVYSSLLSGFVKIAQMLVIQRAIVGVEKGEATYPAELIDELRERFLVYSSRTPFSWACRLRAYAKKVRDSTTSLGCILWNEEGNAVSYKQIGQLTMVSLREFVSVQVRKAQSQLEGLLLLHPQQRRNDLGVDFWMHRVADDASNSTCSWNFLKLERNTTGQLPIRDNWLLERVLDEHWLSDEFLKDTGSDDLRWRPTAVQRYKTRVEEFLESLLLLVHITGGQPGRGTELTSLRHMNTISGYHRNIFADHGIINTVTTYHKGYSITGSAKIIHRFLPKEVGELLVYYLWLVLPFCQKLDLLVYRSPGQPSSFLWPKPGGRDCWGSERLSRVLKREFMGTIGVPMSIVVWRHLAIAISRKHLACGGFKRDYDMDETAFDNQSCHSSRTAGSVYARGLQEAAGHIEARRASYRRVSQEWHAFLGFLPPQLPPRTKFDQICEASSRFDGSKLPYTQSKRSLEDVPRGSTKRMRREIESEWSLDKLYGE